MLMNLIKRIILLLLVAVSLSSLFGCTFARRCVSALRSTSHFIPHKNDPRVLFEPGAKDYANKVVTFLPSAIQQVEEKQYRSFTKPVRVYICASRESFRRMFGADVRAGVLTKLFLSPRVFNEKDEILKMYLNHELSHLHLLQQLGIYKNSRLPFWFTEGLATYTSGGGGAHTVSREQAIDSIKSGRHFVPNESGGFIFQKTPSDFALKPHMFYRQSMMFVEFLASLNQSAFQKFLLAIEEGAPFTRALEQEYKKDLNELFGKFLNLINRTANKSLQPTREHGRFSGVDSTLYTAQIWLQNWSSGG